MAGISVTLEGDNIQLAFQKGEQSTAVVMDPHAARSLVRAVSQLLSAIGESTEEGGDDMPEELVDVTSQTIDVGMDEHGMAVVALPDAGKAVSHTLSFTPQAAGFTELLVRIQPAGEGAAEVVYAIPVLVDAATPAAK